MKRWIAKVATAAMATSLAGAARARYGVDDTLSESNGPLPWGALLLIGALAAVYGYRDWRARSSAAAAERERTRAKIASLEMEVAALRGRDAAVWAVLDPFLAGDASQDEFAAAIYPLQDLRTSSDQTAAAKR